MSAEEGQRRTSICECLGLVHELVPNDEAFWEIVFMVT